jgi:hypothetical protein
MISPLAFPVMRSSTGPNKKFRRKLDEISKIGTVNGEMSVNQ